MDYLHTLTDNRSNKDDDRSINNENPKMNDKHSINDDNHSINKLARSGAAKEEEERRISGILQRIGRKIYPSFKSSILKLSVFIY